jgi:hypothetical protein
LTPNTVRIAEAALAGLRASGISDGDLVDAYNAWCGYVIGFTIIEAKPAEHVPDPNLQRAMRLQLELMTSNPTSLIRALMPDASNVAYGLSWLPGHLGGARSSFEWGLSALLDGFEAAERLSSTSGDVG